MNRIVGIDVSKDSLDAAFCEGAKRAHEVFPNTELGFARLVKWARARGRKILFCMEATGAYSSDVALFLHHRGMTVYIENAKLIKSFRESENERNSTDKTNAFSIAAYGMAHLHRMRPWKPLPDHIYALRELCRMREALVQSKTEWTNRASSRAFVTAKKYALKMIEQAKVNIKVIEKQLRSLIASVPDLKRDVKLLRSIRGIGLLTAAVIIAEVAWIREFDSKYELVAYAGLNPCMRRSGSSIELKPMLSKKGNARLRKALYMPALVALKHNKRIQTLAEALEERKKHKMSIIGAVMRRLLCYAFGVLKSGEPQWAEHRKQTDRKVA